MLGHGVAGVVSAVQEALTSTQRPYVLAEAIEAVRPCGAVTGVWLAGRRPVGIRNALEP